MQETKLKLLNEASPIIFFIAVGALDRTSEGLSNAT